MTTRPEFHPFNPNNRTIKQSEQSNNRTIKQSPLRLSFESYTPKSAVESVRVRETAAAWTEPSGTLGTTSVPT